MFKSNKIINLSIPIVGVSAIIGVAVLYSRNHSSATDYLFNSSDASVGVELSSDGEGRTLTITQNYSFKSSTADKFVPVVPKLTIPDIPIISPKTIITPLQTTIDTFPTSTTHTTTDTTPTTTTDQTTTTTPSASTKNDSYKSAIKNTLADFVNSPIEDETKLIKDIIQSLKNSGQEELITQNIQTKINAAKSIRKLKLKISSSVAEITQLKNSKAQKETSLQTTEESHEDQKTTVEELKISIKENNSKIENLLKEDYQKKIQDTTDQITKLSEHVTKNQEELKTLSVATEQIKTEIATNHEENIKITKNQKKFETEIQKTNKEIKKLALRPKRTDNSQAITHLNTTKLQGKLSAHKTNLNTATQKLQKNNDQKVVLKQSLDQKSNIQRQLEQAHIKLFTEKHQQSELLKEWEVQKTERDQAYNGALLNQKYYNSQISQEQQAMDELQAEISKTTKEIASIGSKLSNEEQAQENLKTQMTSLTKEITEELSI